MLTEALLFLLDVIVQPFAAILLLRFHLQWLRAPMRNPVGELVMGLSNFIVLPARRIIPAIMGFDAASLLLAFVAEALYLALLLWAQGFQFSSFTFVGLWALVIVKLLKISIYLLMGALFVQAILSWINPYSPIAGLLNTITHRFLAPLRRILPPLGNIDLTVLVLIILCQLILIVPMGFMENMAFRLL